MPVHQTVTRSVSRRPHSVDRSSPRRRAPLPAPWLRSACLAALLCLTAPPLSAQQADVDDLREQLEAALATIAELQQRVTRLEGPQDDVNVADDLEAQLQALLIEEPSEPGPPRRTFLPSATNPTIGVFVEALAEGGDADEIFGTNGDRFSLREVEVNFALPISPFADATFVTAFEDLGSGEFESKVEEVFTDVSIGALTDTDSTAGMRVGRFRLPFGIDNRLHTHDLPQADRPLAITQQLGAEGLIGDGLQLTLPLGTSESAAGQVSATTAEVALVNGDLFTGEEALLGGLADGAGLTLDSDAPVLVARASHFVELDETSDVEFGASWITGVGSRAVVTDVMTEIDPEALAVDVTWRSRDDETGQGSWLLSAQGVRTAVDFNQAATPGFPTGSERSDGYWFTAQRQTGATTYWGLRVGSSEVLGADDDISAISPYMSWYADEFFRVRLQAQRLRGRLGGQRRTAHRAMLQLSWNFGAHKPHPYWTNR